MGKIKFTVRVDARAFNAAKRYAGQHGTTVTSLVEVYFRSLARINQIPLDTPVLSELAGSLNADSSLVGYQDYLRDKYIGEKGLDT